MLLVHPKSALLKRLFRYIDLSRKIQLFLLLGLMLVASFAEMLSIGSVLPFISALVNPKFLNESELVKNILNVLGLTLTSEPLFYLTIFFVSAILIAGITRLGMLWATTKISFGIGADLSIAIYRRTLYQPYAVHCSRNSSEMINGITNKSNGVIYGAILPFLTLISSSMMLIAILLTLLIVQPLVAIVVFCGFGCIYLVLIRISRNKLLQDSRVISRESTEVIKSLQEGLGGIRDVLIDGSQEIYCESYRKSDYSLRSAQGRSMFIIASPRYGVEALGTVIIALLAYFLAREESGALDAIPILGALAIGAQRLLPVLQQAYSAWGQISSGQASLQDAIELLEQPLPEFGRRLNAGKIIFTNSICLRDIGFRYDEKMPYVLRGVNLRIEKGSRVGFIGATGSGKSTLLDLVMGLLQPNHGFILVDSEQITTTNCHSWQANIAHVPQAIFLTDSSIEENIAFGVPKNKIDQFRVRQAAMQAQISQNIESWPDGYNTMVGERGIRLSGGQRQRIGIARALYKQVSLIIFDEATSALDTDTELAVMEAIDCLSDDITVLIIAHRTSTLKKCDQIIELEEGRVKSIKKYQDIGK